MLAGGLLAAYGTKTYSNVNSLNELRGKRLTVAAIQMAPKVADWQVNLAQAEKLIREAQKTKAEWIILPEMFTTAAAFHPDMHDCIQPLDGRPMQMMKRLSREGNTVIGGSFLASKREGVFNTFALVFPDGNIYYHDKDFPTYWENCYYTKGNDDGVLDTAYGRVGSVLCWEFIRSGTAKRLLDKVNLIVGGSCWWTVPDDVDTDSPYRKANLKMLKEAAPNMARMLGVPVVHGSHAGNFEGFFSPELPDVSYDSSYLGETMIVDHGGNILSRLPKNAGAGVVTATLEIPTDPKSIMAIPDSFWIPEEMPQEWKDAWTRWFEKGGDYYSMVTKEYLKTGDIPEYLPVYMR